MALQLRLTWLYVFAFTFTFAFAFTFTFDFQVERLVVEWEHERAAATRRIGGVAEASPTLADWAEARGNAMLEVGSRSSGQAPPGRACVGRFPPVTALVIAWHVRALFCSLPRSRDDAARKDVLPSHNERPPPTNNTSSVSYGTRGDDVAREGWVSGPPRK